MLRDLWQQPAVAVDTESDSLYAYHYKVCLIQLSTAQADYLVDPLALPDMSALGDLFADSAVQKVFHAAENDIIALKRGYDMSFANIFDTLWAARVLGWASRNLAAILEERFGVAVDKRMQRTDWGKRPLTPQQLSYARLDSHYLLALRDEQLAELTERGRTAEATEAFVRITHAAWEEKPFDPEGFWRLNGARKLPGRALAVLRELYLWRAEQASELDRPLFKVMGDGALLRLAELQPTDRGALQQVPGVGRSLVAWQGRSILAAIARGQEAPIPHPPKRRVGRTHDAAAQDRFERLRAWRNGRAEARGVDPDVVLSNEELHAIAQRHPTTLDGLAEIETLGSWRRETYGPELLDVLKGTTPG